MPAASTAGEINTALSRITRAVSEGALTPSEGNNLAALLDIHRRGLETADLEQRIERLEQDTKRR